MKRTTTTPQQLLHTTIEKSHHVDISIQSIRRTYRKFFRITGSDTHVIYLKEKSTQKTIEIRNEGDYYYRIQQSFNALNLLTYAESTKELFQKLIKHNYI